MADLFKGFFNIPYGPQLWQAIREWPHDLIKSFNTITKFAEIRCRGYWWVYVVTALPALGEAALALIEFGFDDILRGFLRPYGPRSRLSLRKVKAERGMKNVKKFEIPELGELIGENIPGAQIVKARYVSKAERFLWILDGIAQKALYYWMIVDITRQFFYNWATWTFKSPLCLYGTKDGYIEKGKQGLFNSLGEWRDTDMLPWEEPMTDAWGDYAQGIAYPNYHPTKPYLMILSLKPLYTIDGNLEEWGFRVRLGYQGPILDEVDGLNPHDDGIIAVEAPPGIALNFEYRIAASGLAARTIFERYWGAATSV